MNIALWVIQALLAIAFLGAGIRKITQSQAKLTQSMLWVASTPLGFVRFIGIAEILGAIGLIIPAVTKIAPWLTPVAAIGLAITMVSAALLHMMRKEYAMMTPSIILLLLTLVVILGRFAWSPIS